MRRKAGETRQVKVIQTVNDFPPPLIGGGSYHVYNLTKRLLEEGLEVTVVTRAMRGSLRESESQMEVQCRRLKVHRLSAFNIPRTLYSVAPQILPILLQEDFDIVHSHGFPVFLSDVASMVSRLRGKPFVLTLHGFRKEAAKFHHKIYFKLAGQRVFRMAKRIIAVSRKVAEDFKELGVPEKKIEIIPNGINLEDFRNLPRGKEFRERLNITKDEKLVLSIGRLEEVKGFQHVIMALPNLQRMAGPTKLILAGPEFDYGHELARLVRDEKIADRIKFYGPIVGQEKLEALAAADVIVVPSLYEGFSVFLLEAMAARKPIVATRTGIAPEVIENGTNGYLVNPGDVEDMTEKLARLLNDDKLAYLMSQKSESIVKAFDWKVIARQVCSLYTECLKVAA